MTNKATINIYVFFLYELKYSFHLSSEEWVLGIIKVLNKFLESESPKEKQMVELCQRRSGIRKNDPLISSCHPFRL